MTFSLFTDNAAVKPHVNCTRRISGGSRWGAHGPKFRKQPEMCACELCDNVYVYVYVSNTFLIFLLENNPTEKQNKNNLSSWLFSKRNRRVERLRRTPEVGSRPSGSAADRIPLAPSRRIEDKRRHHNRRVHVWSYIVFISFRWRSAEIRKQKKYKNTFSLFLFYDFFAPRLIYIMTSQYTNIYTHTQYIYRTLGVRASQDNGPP